MPTATTAPHRRQFVLGSERLVETLAPAGWTAAEIDAEPGRRLLLCHHPALPVDRLIDAEGRAWTLLGTALPTSGAGGIAEEVAGAAGAQVDALSRGWAGRFALIGGGEVRTDAGALLPCAHVRDEDGVPLVSSSVALLARHLAPETLLDRPSPVGARPLFLEYIPPPTTRVPDVDLLLPSQVLSLSDGTVSRRALLPASTARTPSEATAAFGDRLLAAMRRLGAEGRPIWLALTAGHDSRLWLAAALATGVPLRTFTIDYPDMKRSDRETPPVVAAAAGVEHRLIPRGRRDAGVLAAYAEHTAGAVVERDRDFLARGQYDHIAADAVLLRSGCFEVGSEAHYPEWPEQGVLLDPPPPSEITERLSAQPDPAVHAALDRWRRWALDAPDEVDWRVRFYLECRLPGWLGAVEQGLDLLAGTSLQLANCGAVYAAALTLPQAHREAQLHQEELVDRWAPALARIPYNAPDPLIRKVARRARTLAQRLPLGR